jgi:DNA polymerase-1
MLIVDTPEKLAEAIRFIQESEMLAYDIETTGLNTRKDSIIGFGVSNHIDGFYFPVAAYNRKRDSVEPTGIDKAGVYMVLRALESKKLLMFNAAFDAVFTLNAYNVNLIPAIHTDVLLLKHTCDEEFPFGLKEIATKLWGHDVKKEKEEMQASIKEAGGSIKQYYKASTETLAKYCVQDCLLTFRVYNYYSSQLKQQGLEKFFYEDEVMPLYREVTIPMERTGVRLDIPLMTQTLADINQDLVDTEQRIQAAIDPHLDLFTAWYMNKEYPYKEKGRIAKIMKKCEAELKEAQAIAYDEDYEDKPMFNLLSKHHLKKLFFDTLKETPISKTELGNPQVDEEFLDAMAVKYAWAAQLIVYNKLTKIKGTYIERMLNDSEDGILYPRFMQHRTVSGRYSGDLQQLPRPIHDGTLVGKYTSVIRKFIIPRVGAKLIGADYEQLEPTIFSHTSGDLALQEIFTSGKDFYSEIAIRTERIKGVSSDKSAQNYLGAVNKQARQTAKVYALGIPYGLTGYKLQFELGVTNEQGDNLVKAYLDAFPALARWMEVSKDQARYEGYVSSEAGRVRHMPRCKELFSRYGARLGDSLQLWKDFNKDPERYAAAKLAHKEYKNLCNNSINFKVQSLAASIMNRASIAIVRKLASEQLKAVLVLQIHDELVLDVPDNEIEQVSAIIKSTMETIYPLSVPLRVTPQIGACYADTK